MFYTRRQVQPSIEARTPARGLSRSTGAQGAQRTPLSTVDNVMNSRPSKVAKSSSIPSAVPVSVSFGSGTGGGVRDRGDSQGAPREAAGRLTAEEVAMAHRILAAQAAAQSQLRSGD